MSESWSSGDVAALVVPGALVMLFAFGAVLMLLRVLGSRRFAPTDSSKPFGLLVVQLDGFEEAMGSGQSSPAARDRLVALVTKITRIVKRLTKRHAAYLYDVDEDIATYHMAAMSVDSLLDLVEAVHLELLRERWGEESRLLESRYRRNEVDAGICYGTDAEYRRSWNGPRLRAAAHFGYGSIAERAVRGRKDLAFEGDVVVATNELLGLAHGGETLVTQPFRDALDSGDRKQQCEPRTPESLSVHIFIPGLGDTAVHRFVPPTLAGRRFPMQIASMVQDTCQPRSSFQQELFSRRSVLTPPEQPFEQIDTALSMISFDSSERSGRDSSPRHTVPES